MPYDRKPYDKKRYREGRTIHKTEKWKAQNRAYMKAKGIKRRAMLDGIKNRPCLDCSGVFPPCAMDFDHVRGEKEFDISKYAASRAWARIQAEIEKCDIVCANCHRVRTFKRDQHRGKWWVYILG